MIRSIWWVFMVKSDCESCGENTFFDFVALDGERRKGCYNWDCLESIIDNYCYEDNLNDIVEKIIDFCGWGDNEIEDHELKKMLETICESIDNSND